MKETYVFRIYTYGLSPAANKAKENLEAICTEFLEGRYQIEIIDLTNQIQLAEDERIFATPTVERYEPKPARRVIGDLSDRQAALIQLRIG